MHIKAANLKNYYFFIISHLGHLSTVETFFLKRTERRAARYIKKRKHPDRRTHTQKHNNHGKYLGALLLP